MKTQSATLAKSVLQMITDGILSATNPKLLEKTNEKDKIIFGEDLQPIEFFFKDAVISINKRHKEEELICCLGILGQRRDLSI